METTRVMETILQRRSYPAVGLHQDSEIRYSKEVLERSENVALLIFPVGVLISSSRQTQQLRNIMFDNWDVAGIFDIGSIFEPATAIRFSLVWLTKQKFSKVNFGTFSGKLFSSTYKHNVGIGVLGEFPTPSSEFRSYVHSIDTVIDNGDLPNSTPYAPRGRAS